MGRYTYCQNGWVVIFTKGTCMLEGITSLTEEENLCEKIIYLQKLIRDVTGL